MPSRPTSAKLERLKRRKAQVQAQIINNENRRKRNRSQQETRRKILVGSYFRRKYSNDGEWVELVRMLDPFLVRPYERSLFGLPESSEPKIDESQLCSDLDVPLKGTILIGAFFMEQFKDDYEGLLKLIDPFLRRSIDRKLFGLV